MYFSWPFKTLKSEWAINKIQLLLYLSCSLLDASIFFDCRQSHYLNLTLGELSMRMLSAIILFWYMNCWMVCQLENIFYVSSYVYNCLLCKFYLRWNYYMLANVSSYSKLPWRCYGIMFLRLLFWGRRKTKVLTL